jgi:steroid 5-alpha reductase family enzyme
MLQPRRRLPLESLKAKSASIHFSGFQSGLGWYVAQLLAQSPATTSNPAVSQNILLFSLALPMYYAVVYPHSALTPADYTLFAAGLSIVGFEFTADNQQWAYQNYKSVYLILDKASEAVGESTIMSALPSSACWPFASVPFTAADAERGFITKGLWAWSRHPNFLCEQCFWVCPFLIASCR